MRTEQDFSVIDKKWKSGFKLYDIFVAAFLTFLLLSNIISTKLIQLWGITLTPAVFLFPVSYIFGDVLTEVYGYAGSRRIIWLGFAANILMVLVFAMAVALPHSPYWANQAAYATILGSVPRIVLASLVSYWVGEFANSFILAKMKEWMISWDPNHKFLFLRTIGSTLVGEGLDSFFFVIVGYIGSLPIHALWIMMLWQWVIKCSIEILFTPLTYVVVSFVKKVEGIDTVGTNTYNPMTLK